MYKVKVITSFSSAHYLPNYRGSCESLHGHNWKVEVSVCAKKLDAGGMVIDFRKLKKIIHQVVEKLDHRCLNEINFFKKNYPSSENIARHIFIETEKKLPKRCQLNSIEVWETENASASYTNQCQKTKK